MRLGCEFFDPLAQDRDGLGCEGRGPSFAAFALHLDVRAGTQGHVGDGERDEFGDAHTGQHGQERHGMVAATQPRAAVGRGEQRFDLVEVEIGERAAPSQPLITAPPGSRIAGCRTSLGRNRRAALHR